MKIGILETGEIPEELRSIHGNYPDMFVDLLGQADPELEFEVFSVVREQYPSGVDRCDAWLVTGSRHGVYDPLPWIEPLKKFLVDAYRRNIPIVGICFGHQILAEALGGKVVKSEKGWGLGVHHYRVCRHSDWLDELDNSVSLNVIHQDQVVQLPPGTTVLAGSEFCPFGILEYEGRAISIQPHPEIRSEYERDLILLRSAEGVFPQDASEEALSTLSSPTDSAAIARAIMRYLTSCLANDRTDPKETTC